MRSPFADQAPEEVRVFKDEAARLYEYDPIDGGFRWREHSGVRCAGKAAGRHVGGYLVLAIYGRVIAAHRVAWLLMTSAWPQGEIDHRDGSRLNNSWVNLRDSTHSQNLANGPRKRATGFKGVSAAKGTGRFRARIKKDRVTYNLGTFDSEAEAHAAYVAAAHRMFGEFARAA